MKPTIFTIGYLVLLHSVSAWSQSVPPDLLRVLKESISLVPSCKVEWNVERIIPVDPLFIEAATKQWDAELASANSNEEKGRVMRNKKSMLASISEKQTIPINIKLDYIDSNKYRISQVFKYNNGPVEYEYAMDNDGVIYGANNTHKSVRLLPQTAPVLKELSRGLPEINLTNLFANVSQLSVIEDKGDHLLLSAEVSTNRLVRLSINKVAMRVSNAQVGIALQRKTNTAVISTMEEELEIKNNSNAKGYSPPTAVIYRKYHNGGLLQMQETWSLVSYQAQPETKKMNSTKYQLKPGYIIKDETGPTPRQILSDKILSPDIKK